MITKAQGIPLERKPDPGQRLQGALRPAVGLLLIGMAACLLLGSLRNDLVYPPEPVFEISSRLLLWIIGGLAGVLGIVCLFARSEFLAAGTVAWFTFTLLLYRAALWVMGAPDAQPYLAMTAADYGVSPRTFEILLAAVAIFAGVWSWGRMFGCFVGNLNEPAGPPSETKHLTTARLGLWMTAAATLALCAPGAAQASGGDGPAGYEVTGCLAYTTYDSLGSPTGKKVMLFRLECRRDLWRIRTEPAVRMQNGIAFHDSSLLSPTSMVLVTGFEGSEKTGSPSLSREPLASRPLPGCVGIVRFRSPEFSSISEAPSEHWRLLCGDGPRAYGRCAGCTHARCRR